MSGVQRRAQDWKYTFKNHEHISSIFEKRKWVKEMKCDREDIRRLSPDNLQVLVVGKRLRIQQTVSELSCNEQLLGSHVIFPWFIF